MSSPAGGGVVGDEDWSWPGIPQLISRRPMSTFDLVVKEIEDRVLAALALLVADRPCCGSGC